jgi:hypothetical protein
LARRQPVGTIVSGSTVGWGANRRSDLGTHDLALNRRLRGGSQNASAPLRVPRRRKHFDRTTLRRREIERHAIYVGAAGTADLSRWLIAWVWHNAQSRDQVGAVMECARRIGRNGFTAAEAATVTEKASEMRRHLSADNLARFLGVTYAVRQRLGLTTIGSINVGTQARKELRKRRNRLTKERKRRALGMRPRAQYEASSFSRTRPWERLGMSRRQWYRKRHQPNGTSLGTAVFLLAGDTPVPPANGP